MLDILGDLMGWIDFVLQSTGAKEKPLQMSSLQWLVLVGVGIAALLAGFLGGV